MSNVFISYQSSDRAVAKRFADLFEARGWSVWWDREIPLGESFDQVIEEALNSATCVVVLWSKQSANSRWVRTEASAAASRDCLVPALIEDVAIPLEFRRLQTANLVGWDGDTNDAEYGRLIAALESRLSGAPQRVDEPAGQTTAPRAVRRIRAPPLAWPVLGLIVVGALYFLFHSFGGRSPASIEPPPVVPTGETSMPRAKDAGAGAADASADRAAAGSPVDATPERAASTSAEPVPAGALQIAIGDRVGDGVPKPGAGSIDTANEQDVYVFNAPPGASVYVRMLHFDGPLGTASWRLVDERGTKLFDTCLGCNDPGVTRLAVGGRYTLTVYTSGAAFGAYSFRLFAVPPPGRFETAIGATIGENDPGPGAGSIESPGAADIYTFKAAAGQRVYFRKLESSSEAAMLDWALTDDDDQRVFSTCLGCGEPGVQTLHKGGEYRLTVGSRTNPGTGTYRIRLTDVPRPSEFTLTLPARVSRGVPAAGAGVIETSGAEDVYAFTVAAGQAVSFNLNAHDPALDMNGWRLLDSNDAKIFESCFACSSPGVQKLTLGGRYRLIVGSLTNASVGAYSFEVAAR